MSQIMTSKVLVLNKNWMPINVCTVFDAVCKTFQGQALFVDPDTYQTHTFESWIVDWDDAVSFAHFNEDMMIRCQRYGILMPSVIVCTGYSGIGQTAGPRKPKFSRRNVYARDKNTCQYCSRKGKGAELNLDHVIPKSRGGAMSWKNIVLSCVPCNDKKRDRSPAEAGMRLIRQPFVPTAADVSRPFSHRLKRKIGADVPKNWESFLGKLYWDSELKDS
jgi:5-methylcytosine-specific restriction endonuclease McrA